MVNSPGSVGLLVCGSRCRLRRRHRRRRRHHRARVFAHVLQAELAAGYTAVGQIVVGRGRVLPVRIFAPEIRLWPFPAQEQQLPQAHVRGGRRLARDARLCYREDEYGRVLQYEPVILSSQRGFLS